ncbi:putative GST C-terminal domain-containing protein [Seiridium cardinale]
MATPVPAMTFYQMKGSCSIVPHILLYHLDLPFRAIPMATDANGKYAAADGSFTHADYVKINPTGYVPALKLGDGTVIAEMPAVLSYIVNLSLESGSATHVKKKEETARLLGRTALEKAQVAQWLAYLSGTLHSLGFAAWWKPYRFVDDHEESYGAVQKKGRAVIETAFARIEQGLGGKQYMIGEEMTVVDLNVYVFYRWGRQIQIEMGEKYKEYTKIAKRIEGLEAVRKVLEVEGLKSCF